MKTPLAAMPRLIRSEVERFGILNTLGDLAVRAVNLVTYFRVLKVLKAERVEPQAADRAGPFRYGFLSADEALELARDPRYDMSESFVRSAFAKGDECYAVREKDRLACYGWCSHKPTAITADLDLHFDDRYVYRYKSYTAEEYRGRHIHAEAIQRALREYQARGFTGLLCYVESNNLGSLRSCRRAGYVDFGEVWVLKLLGRYLVYRTPGCRRLGFGVEPRRDRAERLPDAAPGERRARLAAGPSPDVGRDGVGRALDGRR